MKIEIFMPQHTLGLGSLSLSLSVAHSLRRRPSWMAVSLGSALDRNDEEEDHFLRDGPLFLRRGPAPSTRTERPQSAKLAAKIQKDSFLPGPL